MGVRFAIVGAGGIARLHAAVIAGLPARLVAVADRNPGKAADLAAPHGADAYGSLAPVLDRADVDVVVVCTPSGVHADGAVAALDAGKHVIVEKPVDVTLAAARRIADAERRAGRTVTVISQHRFDPASVAVAAAVRAGRLGRLSSAVVSMAWWRGQDYYDSAGWRGTWSLDGGGALMNQAIHTVDLLVWLCGRPVEVSASTARLAHHGIEVEDTVAATLRFDGGALGVLHATTAAYPGLTARLQIHGDRGSAVIDGDRLAHLGADAVPMDSAAGAGSSPLALDADGHGRQYHDFLDAVTTGRPPLVTVAEATRTLGVVLAIYESARSGRPVSIA
jgi:predicted dehydrogenase